MVKKWQRIKQTDKQAYKPGYIYYFAIVWPHTYIYIRKNRHKHLTLTDTHKYRHTH